MLYMATNPWFLFYDPDKKEICPLHVSIGSVTTQKLVVYSV